MFGVIDPSVEQLIGWLSQLGSAGLAAVAVWWLTNKHEKAIATMTTNHAASFTSISAALDKQTAAMEKRLQDYQDMDRKKIEVMATVIACVNELVRRVDSWEHGNGFKTKV